jgi:NADH dehydrogenase FAD-containing subunit
MENKKVFCEAIHDKQEFVVDYDKLVIAVGVKTNTFGIDSIQEGNGIFFLKHLYHARNIRNNIIDSFEKAALPHISEAERRKLLSFVVVGGGPTSCEFVAELHDFLVNDVVRLYKDLLPLAQITLVEAGPALLGPFDQALQNYAHSLFKKRDVDIRLGTSVVGVEDIQLEGHHFPSRRAVLSDGSSLDFGTMVWSAGLAPVKFTENLGLPRNERSRRILTDEFLRVKGYEGSIWAIGDAAVTEKGTALPQLAQVARQQGIYLSKIFNGKLREDEKPFTFFNLGSMASLGEMKGVYDGSKVGEYGKESRVPKMTGLLALFLWRFAYWGRQTSYVNKILIPMHWFKSYIFGRDISRF